MRSPTLQFADFRLDCSRFELLRNGRALRVERKPMELLILLASRKGELVTRAEIAQHLWSSDVFVDTEHGINTAIRKLRHLLRDDSEDPKFIQTVIGIGYRFIAPITVIENAEPEAVAPNTVATIASDPVKAPSAADPVPAARSDRLWVGMAVGAAVFITVLAVTLGPHPLPARLLHRNTQPAIASLAVIPLDNLSGDPSQEYFADGMTDELITMLAKDSTLRITSRTSVMQYKGARKPLSQIARALNVDGILEGSISRANGQVHMTLQLIRADTDSHLWAESYDRSANDVAALPDEAAKAVAKQLYRAVPTIKAVRYVSPAAHDAYLHGRYLWFTAHMEESGPWFRKAIDLQPDYALAWAGLADYYGEGIAGDVLDPRTSIVPEEQAAQRALELDPDLPEAHRAMGAMFLIDRWDWADADRETLRAISLSPQDGDLYYLRACVLQAANREAEAIDLGKKAMEIDPFSRPYALASLYEYTRQFDATLAEIRLRLEANPNDPNLIGLEMEIRRRMGNYKEAVDGWARWHILMGDHQSAANLRRAYEQGGVRGFVRWQLDRRLLQAERHYVSPVELASYYAQLGDKEQTLALLEEGYRQRATDTLWIQGDPAYDFVRSDPRFRSIVQKTGVAY
ncbi:MAG TPA: winged helix-turn-helix domain-containing protein [Terracidiphilus sp.]|nr:winged helix-turn-helix domain-containing protein [Terracidiphilus sp.]